MPVARIVRIDACGIQCPGPILKLKKSMEQLQSGECLEIRATDAGFPRDAEAWCRMMLDTRGGIRLDAPTLDDLLLRAMGRGRQAPQA